MSKQTIKIIATLGGIGYLPIFSGTAGSLVGLLYFVAFRHSLFFSLSIVFFFFLSAYVCGRAEKLFAQKDARQIIIDDFTGMLISFLFVPYEWRWITAAFLLFRVVDTLKFYPIKKIEEYPGSAGILGDDVAAALYTGIGILLLRALFSVFSFLK